MKLLVSSVSSPSSVKLLLSESDELGNPLAALYACLSMSIFSRTSMYSCILRWYLRRIFMAFIAILLSLAALTQIVVEAQHVTIVAKDTIKSIKAWDSLTGADALADLN